MKYKYDKMKKKILSLFLTLLLFGCASLVFAQGPTSPAGGGAINLPNPLHCPTDPQITCVAQKIISGLLVITTPIVIIMVLIGAFQILAAGGNPEMVTKGRKTILYAVVGYAIVLVAQGLTFIIREALGG